MHSPRDNKVCFWSLALTVVKIDSRKIATQKKGKKRRALESYLICLFTPGPMAGGKKRSRKQRKRRESRKCNFMPRLLSPFSGSGKEDTRPRTKKGTHTSYFLLWNFPSLSLSLFRRHVDFSISHCRVILFSVYIFDVRFYERAKPGLFITSTAQEFHFGGKGEGARKFFAKWEVEGVFPFSLLPRVICFSVFLPEVSDDRSILTSCNCLRWVLWAGKKNFLPTKTNWGEFYCQEKFRCLRF